MPWPVHPNGLLGAQGDSDTYRIERSLRFNSADSAYLSRTPASAGNRKTWTWSGWVKRTKSTDAGGVAQYQTLFEATGSSFSARTSIMFASDKLDFFTDNSTSSRITTNQVFRDFSAWYHIVLSVDTTQSTAANRVRIYINGTEITSFSSSSYPSQNIDTATNTTTEHRIGKPYDTFYFDGYLTEINLIDGQALTPSSFGETDAITGRWKAKAYSGTYGTNGFYLKFADNSGTTATTLGKDSSGNGNNWTPNNFSVDNTTSKGVGNDSLVDSPTNYGADTGLGGEVRGNYATLNPLAGSTLSVYSNGGLQVSGSGADGGNFSSSYSTIGITSGKWYAEFTFLSGGTNNAILGIGSHVYQRDTGNQNSIINGITSINLNALSASDRAIIENGVQLTGGDASFSFSLNDIIGIAFDADARTVNFYKNGLILGSTYPYDVASVGNGVFYFIVTTRVNSGTSSFACNFGQRPFAYTAPSGFKALCTQNLTTPTIQKPSKYMDALAYTGTGASNAISSLGFSPDLVWIKNRGTTTSHAIYDTTRGAQSQISSDTTGDQVTSSSGLTSFDANGFTIGTSTLVNTSGTQYVAWSWDESVQAGLDIVSYTGNGANRTISHNLGVAPKMIIVKARTTAGADQNWCVWHGSFASTEYFYLNSTAMKQTDGASVWNSTLPSSSVFNLGTNVIVNANNDTYIAYLWSEIDGLSKFGTWAGNGSDDGPFVYCGFSPKLIISKKISSTGPWNIFDSKRNTSNVSDKELRADVSTAENGGSYVGKIDILSNGFKLRQGSTSYIGESGDYIFAAFAESAFRYARAR